MHFFKSLVSLLKFSFLDKDKKEFIFFSESNYYRDYYIDLINSLKKLGKKNIILVTTDKKDKEYFQSILPCFYINNHFILNVFFQILECKFMLMTMTDLGSNIPKSKKCKYYVYYFHAMASTHKVYTHKAFSNYDIILANGNYQVNELRSAENSFNFKEKIIVKSGYFFLDNLRKRANLNLKENKTILYAPSWNYNKKNLFDDCSEKIISNLLNDNFKIILRPHPEHYKRSSYTLKKIERQFSDNKNFSIDKDFSNLKSLEKAEILITDNSAIVFEFFFIFKRPVIYIEYSDKIHNLEIDKIKINTLDEIFKKKFGNILKIENLKELKDICNKLIKKNNISEDEVELFMKNNLFNLDDSAMYAANYLIKNFNKN